MSAADEVVAAAAPPLTCDREPRGSRSVVRRAGPAASHSRSRCAVAPCCSDPRRFESGGAHLPASTGSRPDALPFERLPAFDLAVRLRVKRRGTHVRHPRDTNELLKVARDELRPVVGDDPWPSFRVLLLARSRILSMSASFIDSRRSQCTRKRLHPSSHPTGNRTCPTG